MGEVVPSRVETAIHVALNLVPGIGGSLDVLYGRVLAQRRANVETLAAASFSRFPGGAEEFVDRMMEDPRLAELFVEGAEAAMRTTTPAKAAALGRMLADAANSTTDEGTDAAELLMLALMDLEWPHIRALNDLARFPSDAQLEAEHGAKNHEMMNADPRRSERFAVLRAVPPAVVAALVRHGLLTQASGYGLYVAGVSEFGRSMLRYLEAEAQAWDESTDDSPSTTNLPFG